MSQFTQRMIRAAKLDVNLYEEVDRLWGWLFYQAWLLALEV